jgi:hypothetical protein
MYAKLEVAHDIYMGKCIDDSESCCMLHAGAQHRGMQSRAKQQLKVRKLRRKCNEASCVLPIGLWHRKHCYEHDVEPSFYRHYSYYSS